MLISPIPSWWGPEVTDSLLNKGGFRNGFIESGCWTYLRTHPRTMLGDLPKYRKSNKKSLLQLLQQHSASPIKWNNFAHSAFTGQMSYSFTNKNTIDYIYIYIYIHYKYSFYIYIYTNAYSRQIHACFFSPVCCLMATEPRLAPSIALLVQTAHSPSYCVSCGPRTRRLCLDAMVLRLQGSCSSKSAWNGEQELEANLIFDVWYLQIYCMLHIWHRW